MRLVVLDTETTGLEPEEGHRIIEIGCVEIVNRRLTGRHYHQYLKPDREIDAGAIAVHGITNEFLADKPPFHAIVDGFVEFVRDAELIIHNAPFDVGFINHEFGLLEAAQAKLETFCAITDTLKLARQMHPGQKNSLDALCKRYAIDNSQRTLHGALLDAEILADVYLTMTGGQVALQLDGQQAAEGDKNKSQTLLQRETDQPLAVRVADADELQAHAAILESIRSKSEKCVWDEVSE